MTPHDAQGPERATASSNRRNFERRALECACDIHLIGPDESVLAPFRGGCVDISRGGLGLLVPRLLHVGTELFVVLRGPKTRAERPLFGVVRSIGYFEGLGHRVGVQFRAPPQTWQANNFLAGFQARVD